MYSNYPLDTDLGMDSPISLNGMDNSEQKFFFAELDSKPVNKNLKKQSIPILKVNLKSFAKDPPAFKVVNVRYIKLNKNETLLTNNKEPVKKYIRSTSIIKQVKYNQESQRNPLHEKNQKSNSLDFHRLKPLKNLSDF